LKKQEELIEKSKSTVKRKTIFRELFTHFIMTHKRVHLYTDLPVPWISYSLGDDRHFIKELIESLNFSQHSVSLCGQCTSYRLLKLGIDHILRPDDEDLKQMILESNPHAKVIPLFTWKEMFSYI